MGAAEGAHRESEEVLPEDAEWAEVDNLLQEREKPYAAHYRFSLRMKRLWRLKHGDELQQQEAKAMALGEPTKLFHGTSTGKALNIIKSGFKLPEHNGMFGKGVYFADCPLKSAKFAPDESRSLLSSLLGKVNSDLGKFHHWWKGGTKKEGQLLLCDVYLGRSKTLRRKAPNFDPDEDLKRSWITQQLQAVGLVETGEYNSTYVPGGGWFAAVNVPEYVVYQAHQGIPKYFIEFEYGR
jgi:hypothetical protein